MFLIIGQAVLIIIGVGFIGVLVAVRVERCGALKLLKLGQIWFKMLHMGQLSGS